MPDGSPRSLSGQASTPARRSLIAAALATTMLLAPPARLALAAGKARGAGLQDAPQLTALDGAPQPLQRYLGRPLLLNLWATWCAPCVAEMPALSALYRAQGAQGSGRIEILAVNAGQSINQVEQFRAEWPLQLPIALDPQKLALARWQVRVLPTTLLFDASGLLRATWTGERDWPSAAMLREIDDALDDGARSRQQTRRAGP